MTRRTIGPMLAAALVTGLAGGAAALESPPPAPGAPAPEPTNVLRRNEDAAFLADRARRDALLAGLSPVTEATLKAPADGDWLSWRRTPLSTGFSPLKAIDRSNVGRLTSAWSYVLPVSANEMTPLAHDGVLFVHSANRTMALDGVTGDLLWEYTRQLPAGMNTTRAIVRSIAIYGDKVFVPTLDGHMVALNAKTGEVVWDHQVLGEAETKARVNLNGGPIVAKGKVIMGTTSCNSYPGGCYIFALDENTGEEAWRFHSVARPGEPGGDSWNGAPLNERYGGSVWTSGSYDPDLGLVYFGIGNTYTIATLLTPHERKGESNLGLYTAATVALDPDTGKLAWYYQHMTPEVWDLDWAFEQALVTVPVNGRPRDLVVTGGKIAVFDGVDRKTGDYALSVDAGIQTLIKSIDPKTGVKTVDPSAWPERGVTKSLCPHSGGGRNWPASSIDVNTKILYLHLYETCQDYTWRPRTPEEVAAGAGDMQWVMRPRPEANGNYGRLQAIDLTTGKTLWTQSRRAAFASSILTTAGGLTFVGSRDRYFYAYDSADGRPLWRTRLGASPSTTPITYSAGGRQYVAVVAGNGGPVAWPFLTPEVENPQGGVVLNVFALPEAAAVPP